MKPWHWIAIAVVIVIAVGGWYIFQQQNRTLLSIDTPAGSLEVNEDSEGVSVRVNGQ